jgi:hypothetical protein
LAVVHDGKFYPGYSEKKGQLCPWISALWCIWELRGWQIWGIGGRPLLQKITYFLCGQCL